MYLGLASSMRVPRQAEERQSLSDWLISASPPPTTTTLNINIFTTTDEDIFGDLLLGTTESPSIDILDGMFFTTTANIEFPSFDTTMDPILDITTSDQNLFNEIVAELEGLGTTEQTIYTEAQFPTDLPPVSVTEEDPSTLSAVLLASTKATTLSQELIDQEITQADVQTVTNMTQQTDLTSSEATVQPIIAETTTTGSLSSLDLSNFIENLQSWKERNNKVVPETTESTTVSVVSAITSMNSTTMSTATSPVTSTTTSTTTLTTAYTTTTTVSTTPAPIITSTTKGTSATTINIPTDVSTTETTTTSTTSTSTILINTTIISTTTGTIIISSSSTTSMNNSTATNPPNNKNVVATSTTEFTTISNATITNVDNNTNMSTLLPESNDVIPNITYPPFTGTNDLNATDADIPDLPTTTKIPIIANITTQPPNNTAPVNTTADATTASSIVIETTTAGSSIAHLSFILVGLLAVML